MKQSQIKRRIWIILGVIVVFLLAYLIADFFIGSKSQPALEITGPDASGALHSLTDQFGEQGTVLLFFDTKTEKATDLLKQVAAMKKNYDANVMAIAVNGDYEAQKKAVAKLKLSEEILVLYDVDGEMAKTYNVSTTPVTYFIDKNGMVLNKYVFLSSITEGTLKKAFSAID